MCNETSHMNFLVSKCLKELYLHYTIVYQGFPDSSSGKESACYAGDTRDGGLIPGSGRSPGGGSGNPLQYSCLENLRDRGAWLQSMDYTELDITEHMAAAATAATSLQLCLTLCDPVDGSPPGSPVPGILQARTLEWVAVSFSNAWKWKLKVKSLNRVQLLATSWTAAHQAPPSMGFSRQEYWSGVPLPSPFLVF